jgi:5-oxoprolinase (ATP-hydrolysing)
MQAMETGSQASCEPAPQGRGWQFWIDRGGTFTDVIGLSPAAALHVRKVPSVTAGDGAGDPGLAAVRELMTQAACGERIESVKVGTTVATNALLTRSGEPVLLVTTAGFGDALRIGYQNRPDIFARRIVLPQRLDASVIEARERIDVHGNVLTPLDEAQLREALARARQAGRRAVAIVFMHGWRHPQHERAAARCARELGFEEVSVSHELSPLVRYVTRGDTTVLNAYLALPLARYVQQLQQELRTLDAGAQLTLMQSNGGLATPERFHAMASVLSGPAGGLIGMRWVGERLQLARLIGFDMGGTSTDVSLIDGELPQRFEHHIAGVRLAQPMLDVHTIAAGGGSILAYRDGRFAVGPASAGADPGPACYGRGGPLTLTDVQVLLGRLRADTLPAVFGPEGRARIDTRIVAEKFAALAARAASQVAGAAPRKRWRNRFSRSVSSRWPMPFARSPRAAGSMRPTSRCSASAAPPVSMPAAWRAPRACDASWCIRWRACCRHSASASPTGWRCGGRACASLWSRPGWRRRTARWRRSKPRRARSSPPPSPPPCR